MTRIGFGRSALAPCIRPEGDASTRRRSVTIAIWWSIVDSGWALSFEGHGQRQMLSASSTPGEQIGSGFVRSLRLDKPVPLRMTAQVGRTSSIAKQDWSIGN